MSLNGIDQIVAKAAPPPERADASRFQPVATDAGSFERRRARLIQAFGSEAQLAAHARSLGLAPDEWLNRFRDVRLSGARPDWAETFCGLYECLAETPDQPPDQPPVQASGQTSGQIGSQVRDWARAAVVAAWPQALPRGPNALDLPLDSLIYRLNNVAAPCVHTARQLRLRETWPERFRRHPALAYVFGRCTADWRDDLLRIARCAAHDRGLIARALFDGDDPGRLVGITPILGDPHAGARSVAFLDFERGRVVYKPKDLRVVTAVGEIVRALDEPAMAANEIHTRDGYAWERFYEPRPLAERADADVFFGALGGWQALLQVLSGTDFWFDNLLADGATPRFIDFETAVQPMMPWPHGLVRLGGRDGDLLRLAPSNIGILPFPWPLRDGDDATDLGCLARPGEHRTPLNSLEPGKLFSWSEDRFAPHDGDGAPVDVGEHFAAFEAGHERVARAFAEPKFQARVEQVLQHYREAPVRVILIDTWSCYRAINRSCVPPRLSDSVWREIDLHNILRNWPDIRGEIREAAVRDLRRLDIPLFSARLGSRDLFGVGGERERDYFERDAIAHARERMRTFAGIARDEHRAWLRSGFSLRYDNPPRCAATTTAPAAAAEDLLAWADEIASDVVRRAARDENGAPAWIGLVHNVFTDARVIGPMEFDVLSGRAGLGWTLLELAACLERGDLAELARETLAGAARDYLKNIEHRLFFGAGFAVGGGGLVAALAQVAELRPLALEVFEAASQREIWMKSGEDYVSGLAGWREAARAVGRPAASVHGAARPYAPSARPRLAHWLATPRHRLAPLCPDRHAAACRRLDRERHDSWFAASWLDDRHNSSGIDGVPALALAFARLAESPAAAKST